MRCVACNSTIQSAKRKRPVTTMAGEMNSAYTDHLVGFPKNEEEDLCSDCARWINYYNYDMNENAVNPYERREYLERSDEAFEDNKLDAEFEVCQDIYLGYRDTGL